jgi:hypothetical protein
MLSTKNFKSNIDLVGLFGGRINNSTKAKQKKGLEDKPS